MWVEFIRAEGDGNILLGSVGDKVTGLLQYQTTDHFLRDEYSNLLPGKAVSNFIRDNEGGWWVTSLNAGIFYCKNPELEIYDNFTGESPPEVLNLTSDAHGGISSLALPQEKFSLYRLILKK